MDKTETPLIVQGDSSLLLDVHNEYFDTVRSEISSFTELEKSPEHIHTYRISPLSLWNAASAGLSSGEIIDTLSKWSRFSIPENIIYSIKDIIGRFGKLILLPSDLEDVLFLSIKDKTIISELKSHKTVSKYLIPAKNGFFIKLINRGTIKYELIKIGYPVQDNAGLTSGEPLDISFRKTTLSGHPFNVRDYQIEAAKSFYGGGMPGNGFGTVVLACGAGKTVVGMKVMELLKTNTLILSTNVAAVHQWIEELIDKTNIKTEDIGEYTSGIKKIRPVTIATYQILTWRNKKEMDFPHFRIFKERNWGLIIYDEVHLLPAPVFRITAEIQSVRRLGLTATLVREDGKENEVFSLVGPKRYDVPWKELESKGWIAEANCHEIHVDLPKKLKVPYATADKRKKYRIAAENPLKQRIAKQIIENHRSDSIIVIGQYIKQLNDMAKELKAPIITGKVPNLKREEIYRDFKKGKTKIIVVSKVANFAIDLPDASVAIQISGTFGSRQEEAQRLGRILRPKKKNAYFYSIISRYTVEETFAANRQKFLAEQGYKYHVELWDSKKL